MIPFRLIQPCDPDAFDQERRLLFYTGLIANLSPHFRSDSRHHTSFSAVYNPTAANLSRWSSTFSSVEESSRKSCIMVIERKEREWSLIVISGIGKGVIGEYQYHGTDVTYTAVWGLAA